MNVHRPDEIRQRLLVMEVDEATAPDARRLANERERALAQMPQHVRRHYEQIAQVIASGVSGQAFRGRPQHLVEMREWNPRPVEIEYGVAARGVKGSERAFQRRFVRPPGFALSVGSGPLAVAALSATASSASPLTSDSHVSS